MQKFKLKGYVLKSRDFVQWKCVFMLVSYCCDIPDSKEISAELRGVAVRSPCDKCMLTGEDVTSGEIGYKRSVKDTKIIRSRYIGILRSNTGVVEDRYYIVQEETAECGKELFRNYHLSTWTYF